MVGVGKRGDGTVSEVPAVRIRPFAPGNLGREIYGNSRGNGKRIRGNGNGKCPVGVRNFGVRSRRFAIGGSYGKPGDPPSVTEDPIRNALSFGGDGSARGVRRNELPGIRGTLYGGKPVEIIGRSSGGLGILRGIGTSRRRVEDADVRRNRVPGVGKRRIQTVSAHALRVAHVERVDDGGHLYELAFGDVFVGAEGTVGIRGEDSDVGTLLGVAVPVRIDVFERSLMRERRGIDGVVPKSCLTEEHGSGFDAARTVLRAERDTVP